MFVAGRRQNTVDERCAIAGFERFPTGDWLPNGRFALNVIFFSVLLIEELHGRFPISA